MIKSLFFIGIIHFFSPNFIYGMAITSKKIATTLVIRPPFLIIRRTITDKEGLLLFLQQKRLQEQRTGECEALLIMTTAALKVAKQENQHLTSRLQSAEQYITTLEKTIKSLKLNPNTRKKK